MDRQKKEKAKRFHDIREKPRKMVLEILVNKISKPNPCPLLQIYKSQKPQLWLYKESNRPDSAKGAMAEPSNNTCHEPLCPREGPV